MKHHHDQCATTDRMPSQNAAKPQIYDMETVVVYEAQEKPGHCAWPAAFVDNDGGVCVVFQQTTGNLTEKSSFEFRQPRGRYSVKLIGMRAAKGGSKFRKIFEKEMVAAHSFMIPAPTPSRDGKMIAMCRPSANTDFQKYPEFGAIIVESDDYGQTMKVRSVLSVPGLQLYCNDMKYIGKRLYVATYDGSGAAHLFYSDDDGCTWSQPLTIVMPHDNKSFHEPAFCELANGNLVVFLRTHRMDIPKHNGINYHKVVINKASDGKLTVAAGDDATANSYYFDENGRCIPSPALETPFGFRGRPSVQRTSDGTILLLAPGHFLAFSKDDCATWHVGTWDFNIPKVSITDAFGTKPYNWNAETTILELPDGRFYYSYFIGSDFPFPPPCDMYIGGTFLKIRKQ